MYEPTEMTLRDLALAYPAALSVLDAYHLDYCCGGQRSLAEACLDAGIDPEHILREVAEARPPEPVRFSMETLADLVAHIVETHHAYTNESLGRIDELMTRVRRRHGAIYPHLYQLQACYNSLASDLKPHLKKEEEILFPYILALEAHAAHGTPLPAACFGSVAAPIAVMNDEHEALGALLKSARALTRDYSLPADACASFQRLYQEFEALEMDLMCHIHLENNILFPRALRLASEG